MRLLKTMRSKIIFTSTLLVAITLITSAIWFFYTFYQTQTETIMSNTTASAEQLQQSMETTFQSIDNVVFSLLSTDWMRAWLSDSVTLNPNYEDYYVQVRTLQESALYSLLFHEAWTSQAISATYLISDDIYLELLPANSVYAVGLEDIPYAMEYFAENAISSSLYIPPTSANSDIMYLKKIINQQNTKEMYILISINKDCFEDLFETLPTEAQAVVMQDEIVMFSTQSDLIGSAQPEFIFDSLDTSNGSLYGVTSTITDTPFTVSVALPHSYFISPILESMQSYAIILFALLVLFVTITIFSLSSHTRFLGEVHTSLAKATAKDYTVRMHHYPEQDLNAISDAFNTMIIETKQLIDQIHESESALKRSEIEHLQAQINPHFLTNTLATISTTALLHQDDTVYEMVSSLNELLTAFLLNTKQSSSFVTIEEELEYVKKYLFIQQIRFQDRLNYCIDITDPNILSCYIPRLTLQPLVENAVIHGIEKQSIRPSNAITVRGSMQDQCIHLVVSDDGCGFEIQELFSSREKDQTGHHLGVFNTHHRLQLHFGEKYGLQFQSELNVGTDVTVTLPAMPHFPTSNIPLREGDYSVNRDDC